MLGVYNYTVILTYLGMLAGFAGIVSAMDGNLHTALLCLMIAGVCDMFDGTIAATLERSPREKRFGIQIDSLSDLICFGALPAIIVYITSEKTFLAAVAAGIYLLCALIRLAWFNVDEEERQHEEGGCRKVYLGLPVTTAALIIPALIELGWQWNWRVPVLAPATLLAMAAAFLTPFRLRKPRLPGKAAMAVFGVIELAFLIMRVRL